MSAPVTNQAATYSQARQNLLAQMQEGNETLTKLKQAGKECAKAQEDCTAAMQAKKTELAKLTSTAEKIHALLTQVASCEYSPDVK